MSLKDFRTNASDLPEEPEDTHISSSLYLKERSELKIDKLSNRVTLISVMLPMLIGAVLFFIYLDIKDQVMDVDVSKKNQVEYLTRQSEEKLNALDMRIAKNRFDLDEKLPLLEKKGQSLENQVAKLADSKAESTALEAGIQRLEDLVAKHDQRINNNAAQDRANLAELERINANLLSAMARDRDQVEKSTRALVEKTTGALKQDLNTLKKDLNTLKEHMDTKIIDLQRLQMNVSLLDKLVKDLENQFMARKEVKQRLSDLENKFNQEIRGLETQMKKSAGSRDTSRAPQPVQTSPTPSEAAPDSGLKPEVIDPDTISEQTLTQ
jgi:chromosome segregation ATPase